MQSFHHLAKPDNRLDLLNLFSILERPTIFDILFHIIPLVHNPELSGDIDDSEVEIIANLNPGATRIFSFIDDDIYSLDNYAHIYMLVANILRKMILEENVNRSEWTVEI